jgi:parvulin-like peptidyl-prolyl isomerase
MSVRTFLYCFVVLSLAVSGCSRKTQSPVVARVGDAVLTVADLEASIPVEYRDRITREQNVNYVKQWIDTELLYQEALKRKYHKDEQIRARVESMRRDLLSADLLTRENIESGETSVTDTMVQQYYQQNRETFVRPREVVRVMQMVLETFPLAQSVKAQATPASFARLAEQHGAGQAEEVALVPFVPLEELPVEFKTALRDVKTGVTVGPIPMEDGFYLLHLVDRQPPGSVATLDEVRETILERLNSQVQKRAIERFLSQLRMRTNVTYNFAAIPGSRGVPTDSVVNE